MRRFPENSSNTTRFDWSPSPSLYPTTLHNYKLNQNNRWSQDSDSKFHPRQQFSSQWPTSAPAVASKESFSGELVKYNLSSFSNTELKQLKEKLISDLESVRSLIYQIQTGNQLSRFRPGPVDASNHASKPPGKKRSTTQVKKKRKVSGKKRTGPSASGSREKPVLVLSEEEKVMAVMMKKCKQILMALRKHPYAWVFNKPLDVKALGLHDYFQIIDRPMDLGTVRTKLERKIYRLPLDFAADVRLTFENALKYNPKGQDVHTMAEIMLSSFEGMFQPAYQKFEADYPNGNVDDLIVVPLTPGEPVQATKSTSLSPVLVPGLPIEQDIVMMDSKNFSGQETLNVVNKTFSFEEKLKLGAYVQNLPSEKMGELLNILGKRNPHFLQDVDELELDIGALDDDTIWELENLVNSSADNDNEFNSNIDQSVNQTHKSPQIEPPVQASSPMHKKKDAGEEDVDIGEEIPSNYFPPVVIEKDIVCASGRSSGSGGSSSTSDDSFSSDSDSESDSDEDSVQSPYVEPKVMATD